VNHTRANNLLGLPAASRCCAAVWLAAVALSLIFAAPARAAEILAILSSDAQPYRDAQAAMETSLIPCGHHVTTILLSRAQSADAEHPLPKADLIVAVGTDAAVWAHEHSLPPVYYCMVPSAAQTGLDKGPVCRGLTTDVPLAAQIALIAQALPAARTIGMLYRSDTSEGRQAKDLLQAALPPGYRLEAVAINESESKAKAIDDLLSRKIDAVWTAPDPAIFDVATIRSLLLAALRHSVPVYGFSQAMIRAGALVGANIAPSGQGAQLARLICTDLDTTAKAPTRPLPALAQAPEHQIVLNLIVAEKLSIRIPDALVQQAATVFRDEAVRNGGVP
jgi:ABC-type uncharacterized transport system substrate-binding protein